MEVLLLSSGITVASTYPPQANCQHQQINFSGSDKHKYIEIHLVKVLTGICLGVHPREQLRGSLDTF